MKVYLSSTFRDLRDHRAAVDRTLRRMGHDVIGMEQYAAEGSRPIERCKRDVETADCYVLMLGWRYGYVPVEDNPDRLSIGVRVPTRDREAADRPGVSARSGGAVASELHGLGVGRHRGRRGHQTVP